MMKEIDVPLFLMQVLCTWGLLMAQTVNEFFTWPWKTPSTDFDIIHWSNVSRSSMQKGKSLRATLVPAKGMKKGLVPWSESKTKPGQIRSN